MLDQNTDRMWYVIGAVIIGAAIIFILNNTFPQLFASVGETFQGKTEQVTEMTDGIYPVGYKGVNLIGNKSDEWKTHTAVRTANYYGYSFMSLDELGLEAGDKITMSGQYDYGEYSLASRLMFTPDPREPNDVTEINLVSDFLTGSGTFVHTVVIPEDSHYLSLMIQNQNHDGQGIGFPLSLKELKLETGSVATPY